MFYFFAFVVGTIFGSFFYTLALKYISGEIDTNLSKALLGRSQCPFCGNSISPISLVPLIGYLFSLGRCSNCKGRISPAYPLSEISYGLMTLMLYHNYGQTLSLIFSVLIFSLLICISIIDYKIMIIPDSLLIVLIISMIVPVIIRGDYLDNLYGFILVTVFMLIIMFVFPGAFGGGDLKLLSIGAFYFGFDMSMIFLETSLIIGAISGIAIAISKGRNFKLKIPFGPFISLGFIITELFGNKILLWYYSVI